MVNKTTIVDETTGNELECWICEHCQERFLFAAAHRGHDCRTDRLTRLTRSLDVSRFVSEAGPGIVRKLLSKSDAHCRTSQIDSKMNGNWLGQHLSVVERGLLELPLIMVTDQRTRCGPNVYHIELRAPVVEDVHSGVCPNCQEQFDDDKEFVDHLVALLHDGWVLQD
jgi:tRNA U54 and U55 pseudouridine synthase Pus10